MLFKGPDDALQWVRDVRQTAAPVRNELGRRVAQGFLYYEGIHWIEEDRADTRNGLRRLQTNYNPDTNQLRVTANQVSYRIQKVMASTFPDRLAVEAIPPDRDFSATTIQLAKACQDAVNFGIDESGYLKARRNANANRCIAGTWGIGFSLATYAKVVKDETVQDACLKAFDFDPLRLTLDPYMESSDLNDHEVVVYSDAWTHRKLTRLFGIEFSTEQMENLPEIGQITAYEQAIAAVSSGRIMSHYRTHSKTKGALVHQIHAKSPGSDRFDMMYVVVEMGEKRTYIPKGFESGMETPFGGSGLPLALLHAHHRPRSPWGISDVMMMKEDQNLLNLFKTAEARMMIRSAGFQILLDKRSVPKGTTNDDARNMFSNTVSGVVQWESSDRNRGVTPPQVLQYPQPPQHLSDISAWHTDQIREKSHRAEGTFGQTKSHVPDSSFQRALDEADQVLGARVRNDTQTDGMMLTTMLGTLARLAKEDNPSTLAMLNRAGLSGDDINALGKLDPQKPLITVAIRESSVRYRSRNARVQDLLTALQSQAIDPIRYRTEMARTLDSPIVEMDGVMVNAAAKAVQDILLGQEWEPVPLAEYTTVFQDQFRAAMFDKKATPEAKKRLQRAISNQLAMDAKERGMSDPAMDIQRQNAEIEADAQAGEQVEASLGDTPAEPQTLHDVLTAMEGTTSAASSATTIPYAEPTA